MPKFEQRRDLERLISLVVADTNVFGGERAEKVEKKSRLRELRVRAAKKVFEKKIFFEQVGSLLYLFNRARRFRCSFRVSIEVLLVMRFEQRANSWPHYPSERLGEGV
jgi:hypothetical protein